MFWEAMVVMKRGSAMPIKAAGEKLGATRTGSGQRLPTASRETSLVKAINSRVTRTAAGTA